MAGKKRGKAKKQFSESEIVGLKVLAEIIRQTREAQPVANSGRKFAELIGQDRNSLQRSEKAGQWDAAHDNFIDVPDSFIVAILGYTPYSLADLINLKFGRWKDVTPLSAIVAQRKIEIGEAEFLSQASAMRLRECEINGASSGFLYKEGISLLASLLQTDIQTLLDGAIIDLVHKYLDVKNSHPTIGEKQMCVEVAEEFKRVLRTEGFDLSKRQDYEKFCQLTGYDKGGRLAQRLREISLGAGSPPSIDEVVDLEYAATKVGGNPIVTQTFQELAERCKQNAC